VGVAKGVTGAYAAWDQMLDELKPGEEYLVLGASWQGQKQEVYDYFIDFHRRRQKKNVKARFLFVPGTRQLVKKHGSSYFPLAQVRFLPKSVYEGMQINIYHNKVLMFVWRKSR